VSRADHFTRQAKRCWRLASGCTDRAMAARLQELAKEYEAKAAIAVNQHLGPRGSEEDRESPGR
jgi:hypothetical protein